MTYHSEAVLATSYSLYYLWGENKVSGQQCSYCITDLHIRFRIYRLFVFRCDGLLKSLKYHSSMHINLVSLPFILTLVNLPDAGAIHVSIAVANLLLSRLLVIL